MDSPEVPAKARTPLWRQLYIQVLIGLVLGAAIGLLWPQFASQPWMKAIGDGFIKLIKMTIAVLVFCTVVSGIGQVTEAKQVGRVGIKTILYFEIVSTFALVIGLLVANFVRPGAGMRAAGDAAAVAKYVTPEAHESLSDFLLHIIPDTLLSGFAEGNILQVLLVAILTGFALQRIGPPAQGIRNLIDEGSHLVFDIINMIMKLAPLGAAAAMAFTLGKYGAAALGSLLALIATFYVTAALFIFVVLGLIAWWCGFSIFRFVAYLRDELLIVLGTSSSESALPNLMRKMEALGCSRPVVGLVIPTGYSFNLDGTNIYMTLASLFIAQALGYELTMTQQLTLLGVAMLTSKGATGVTGAGFITLGATLAVVNPALVPGMAIVLGIDKFMSECRALTNFIGNGVACVVISRWEGELDKSQLKAGLNPTKT
ncbi:C4-dicarboxylate transport protein [Asticcacaulis biprosthecium C19]|uniref:C4-dicarboxylate transport protein n=1 Tax=Asticcacaulis biprosthecium C19 TaxID=715226 RepID=F4QNE6_9CAUL|nr:C4-dicarboxylate transporter DctA [Asticcacaulis biprosthecium]EGF90854.1 C4-dicarboxylate transport protein [Asticcacaulis biprosthecium C19]